MVNNNMMDTTAIKKMLKSYFDAFYNVDTKALHKIFHEKAHIYGHDEQGNLEDIDKKTFLKIISSFNSNGENPKFVRNDEILAIDFISKDVAVARVKLRFSNLVCTDILNLICLDGEWYIISVLDYKESV